MKIVASLKSIGTLCARAALSLLILAPGAPLVVLPVWAQGSPGRQAEKKRMPPKRESFQSYKAVPADCPLPLPPGTRFVTGYQSKYSRSKATVYLRLESNSPIVTLAQFYKQAMRSGGWDQPEREAAVRNGSVSLSANKGSSELSVDLSHQANGTAIGITYFR